MMSYCVAQDVLANTNNYIELARNYNNIDCDCFLKRTSPLFYPSGGPLDDGNGKYS